MAGLGKNESIVVCLLQAFINRTPRWSEQMSAER